MASQKRVLFVGEASDSEGALRRLLGENAELLAASDTDSYEALLQRLATDPPDQVVLESPVLERMLKNLVALSGTRKSLEESETRFRRISDRIQDGIILMENNRPVYINDRACEIFGYSRDELLQLDSVSLAAPEDKELLRSIHEQAQSTGSYPESMEF
jgi:PAS domain-containing protein